MNTLRKHGAKYNVTFCTLAGLSTDTKPVGTTLNENRSVALANGSEFIEMDTGKKYIYDAENQQWNLASSGGGGGEGGTSNYADLTNKPQINGVTLVGNKKLADLGIAAAADIPTVPITEIQKNSTKISPVSGVVNISVPTTAADVNALPDTTKYAASLSLTINPTTFVMTGQLKDQNGNNLGTAQTIDLPLESVVVNGSYNSQTKKVVLALQSGSTIEFSVADLVAGLQTELSSTNKLNPTFINYDSTHRAVSDDEKVVWNGKQSALSSAQLAAVNSGITSTDVAQITTNKNNILSKAIVGICNSSSTTSAKVVEIDNFVLQKGCIIGVKFSDTNTASNVTLNVSNTGAKSIYYNNAVYNGNSYHICGKKDTYTYYMYDGTNWCWVATAVSTTPAHLITTAEATSITITGIDKTYNTNCIIMCTDRRTSDAQDSVYFVSRYVDVVRVAVMLGSTTPTATLSGDDVILSGLRSYQTITVLAAETVGIAVTE